MRLPNALVIGPMRCGTTWIDRYLRDHGGVCLPHRVKETFYFDRRYAKGPEWYGSHFATCAPADDLRICEVGASYFHSREAPERVAETLGEIPLVVIVRHPVERSYSHYLHLLRYGFTSLPLRAAVEEHPEILQASRYGARLQRWLTFHDRRNLHLLSFETLKSDSEAFVARLAEVLGVPARPIPEELFAPSNRGAEPRSGFLAGVGWKVSDFLRGRRLHGAVELAKKIGLKKLFFARAGGDSRPVLSDDDRRWLRKRLADDLAGWRDLDVDTLERPARGDE